MKSEKRKIDLIFRFRHCLAFVTIIIFLLIYGFVSNATQTQTGSTADMDLLTYYGISEPVFFTRDGINAVVNDSSVLNYSVIPSTGATIGSGYYDGTESDAFCFISSVAGNTVDFNNGYHIFASLSYGSCSTMIYDNEGVCYLEIHGSSVNVRSLSPFKFVMRTTNSDGSYVIYEYDNAYSTSFADYTEYNVAVNVGTMFLTDMPINIASSNSSTGYSSGRDYDVRQASNYIDFNYLVNGGSIIPDYPNQVNDDTVLPYAQTGLNYIFGTVEPKFGTPSDMGIFATYDFKLNTYMLTHPEEYTFVMNHKFVINTNYGDKSFYYNRELTIADILYHNDQEFNIMLDYGSFVSNDDMNMKEFLLGFYSFNGNSASSYTDGSVISYGAGNAGQTRTFGGFTAGVREQYFNHVSVCKFYYECYFVWHGAPETTSGKLKGWKDLLSNNNRTTQNDIGTNYYPPSESDIANYPETPSSGNTTNNGGVFNDGDVIIMNGNQPWTPYTLDQVSYGNVKDMFDDIKDFVDSSSSNSFWSVLTSVLKPTSFGGYIPDKIWEYITISVAVICGFAVVRYVLRR